MVSDLISQCCLRLITQIPLGGEKRRRGRNEKATQGSTYYHFSFISAAFHKKMLQTLIRAFTLCSSPSNRSLTLPPSNTQLPLIAAVYMFTWEFRKGFSRFWFVGYI